MSIPQRSVNPQKGIGSGMKEPPRDIVTAAKHNDIDLVKEILAEEPGRINDYDSKSRMTALHWAGANVNYELAEFLFAQKNPPVDFGMRDYKDRFAFDHANEMGNQRVIELFFKNLPEDPEGDEVQFETDAGPQGGMEP